MSVRQRAQGGKLIDTFCSFAATLKDFFRELPEPLFTNALYPMVYEATQVAGPGDSHMGTKLILNILDCLPTSNQVSRAFIHLFICCS